MKKRGFGCGTIILIILLVIAGVTAGPSVYKKVMEQMGRESGSSTGQTVAPAPAADEGQAQDAPAEEAPAQDQGGTAQDQAAQQPADQAPAPENSDSADIADAAGVTPEFKEMMDAYEAFFDEYIEFMQKYVGADSISALGMAADYADYMARYVETMQKLEALDQSELSDADVLYYTDVYTRIMKKLAAVTVTLEG